MSEYIPSFIIDPVLRQARRFSERMGTDEQQNTASATTRDQIVSSPLPVEGPIQLPSPSARFGLPNLPQFPSVSSVDFQRFYPSRLWNQSPPESAAGGRKPNTVEGINDDDDDVLLPEEGNESTLQSIARNIQLWANQINNLDMFPSPPLEPVVIPPSRDRTEISGQRTTEVVAFPPLDIDVLQETPPSSQSAQSDRALPPTRTDSETSLNPAHELSYRSQVVDRDGGRSYSDPLVAPNIGHNLVTATSGHQVAGADSGREREWSGSLPEDDGMGPVRQRITAIWTGSGTAQEKSRLVHALMTERYRQGQALKTPTLTTSGSQYRPLSPSTVSTVSHEGTFNLFPSDWEPTYAPSDPQDVQDTMLSEPSEPMLGCVHYKRNVKMQCNQCEKWFTCRLCHDEVEDHQLPRRDTKHMLCMLCGTPQRVGQDCRMCGVQAACYYCSICKLWNNDPEKSVYHCDDCGICRLGEGLGKDFFHCKKCAACMSIQAESTHKCIERSTRCDCPICGEYMFTSNKPVAFMRCGHSIHETCFADWCNTSYKCPICSKSIANMESQFRRLDRHIEEQPMPEDYSNNRAYIFCNDCNSRCVTKYHWLGLKCVVCDSYNTAQLELLGAESPQFQARADQAQQMGVGEAGFTASQSQTPTGELTEPVSGIHSGRITPSDTRSNSMPVTAIERDSSASGGLINLPPSRRDSPFHAIPHQSPSSRPVRGLSPIVGSYFGTGQARMPEHNRRSSYLSVFSNSSTRDNTDDLAATLSSTPSGHDVPSQRLSARLSQLNQADRNSSDSTSPLVGATSAQTDPLSSLDEGKTRLDDDDNLDFWGGQSPRSYESELVDAPQPPQDDEASSSEDELEDMDGDEDGDDDDDDDLMDILGHR